MIGLILSPTHVLQIYAQFLTELDTAGVWIHLQNMHVLQRYMAYIKVDYVLEDDTLV